ncbi:MAG: hypothetical protein Q9183_001495 [Haloplaca sp. 2 TL-2023]
MVGLKLDFVPSQPSRLRYSSGPRSPASPLASPSKRIRFTPSIRSFDSSSSDSGSSTSTSTDPPPSPYKWMWYCHECRTGYEVGVTRRCLIDDHQLCYGQPVKKRSRKNKKVRACQSEFDYTGWQNWGAWKRGESDANEAARHERNCFGNCDWPSQCRWSHKQEEKPAEEKVVSQPQPAAEEMPSTVTVGKANDTVLAKLSTATQKLATHWVSMLSPVEEEPSATKIEDFLNSAKNHAAMEVDTEDDASFYDTASGDAKETAAKCDKAFGLGAYSDFDFGFHQAGTKAGQQVPNSKTIGVRDLVASTVGIALAVPGTPTSEQCCGNGRRCVSEPPALSVRQRGKLDGGRRRSAF